MTKSNLLSPLKSAETILLGPLPVKIFIGESKEPVPCPKINDKVSSPELVTARSIF